MRLLFTISLLLTGIIVNSQTKEDKTVTGLKFTSISVGKAPFNYNHSKYDWEVYKQGDTVYFREEPRRKSSEINEKFYDSVNNHLLPLIAKDVLPDVARRRFKIVIPVTDGWIIGTNSGEWGGCAFWLGKSLDTAALLIRGNIVDIFPAKSGYTVLTGLCHLDISEGKAYELKNKGKWTADTLFSLGECPYAGYLDEDKNVWVIADKRLVKINHKKRLEVIAENKFWEILYPTSVIKQNDYLYIGMRKGIMRYNLKSKTFEWAVPVEE